MTELKLCPWCDSYPCNPDLFFIPAGCTTEKIMKLAEHFIGMDCKKSYKRHGKMFYKPYRNYFASGEHCDGVETLLFMEEQGLASRKGYTFFLTRKGLDWLGELKGVKIYDEE